MTQISLGRDDEGVEHFLAAERNLHHSPDSLCGCNPDAYNTENPYGSPPTSGVWEWAHHPYREELVPDRHFVSER